MQLRAAKAAQLNHVDTGESKAVIFDVGGVLVQRTEHGKDIAHTLSLLLGKDIDATAVTNAYWRHRDDYDRGADATDYWSPIFTAAGISPDKALIDEVASVDGHLSSRIDADTATMLRSLKKDGFTLLILSNAPHAMKDAITQTDWFQRNFSGGVFSCDAGCAKPDADIYRLALSRLRDLGATNAQDTLFFDDKLVNVDAAKSQGIQAYQWEDIETTLAKAELHL